MAKKVAKKKKKVTKDIEVVSIPDKEPEHILTMLSKSKEKEVPIPLDENLKIVQDALSKFGQISDIPMGHPYWKARFRIKK